MPASVSLSPLGHAACYPTFVAPKQTHAGLKHALALAIVVSCPRPSRRYLSKRTSVKKSKGSPYSITKRRVPELIPVLGSQP